MYQFKLSSHRKICDSGTVVSAKNVGLSFVGSDSVTYSGISGSNSTAVGLLLNKISAANVLVSACFTFHGKLNTSEFELYVSGFATVENVAVGGAVPTLARNSLGSCPVPLSISPLRDDEYYVSFETSFLVPCDSEFDQYVSVAVDGLGEGYLSVQMTPYYNEYDFFQPTK